MSIVGRLDQERRNGRTVVPDVDLAPLLDALTAQIRDDVPSAKIDALELLGEVGLAAGTPAAVEVLVLTAATSLSTLLDAVTMCLCRVSDPARAPEAVVRVVLRTLSLPSDDVKVRAECAYFLGRYLAQNRHPDAITVLCELARAPREKTSLRRQALAALLVVRSDSLVRQTLRSLREDPDPAVRSEAAELSALPTAEPKAAAAGWISEQFRLPVEDASRWLLDLMSTAAPRPGLGLAGEKQARMFRLPVWVDGVESPDVAIDVRADGDEVRMMLKAEAQRGRSILRGRSITVFIPDEQEEPAIHFELCEEDIGVFTLIGVAPIEGWVARLRP